MTLKEALDDAEWQFKTTKSASSKEYNRGFENCLIIMRVVSERDKIKEVPNSKG